MIKAGDLVQTNKPLFTDHLSFENTSNNLKAKTLCIVLGRELTSVYKLYFIEYGIFESVHINHFDIVL